MGSFLTPWQSDTLYGSLCWELGRIEGETALQGFLERCRAGDPPFVLSDAFPGRLLPAPFCLYRLAGRAEPDPEKRLALAREWKRRAWLPEGVFKAICSGRLPPLPPAQAEPLVQVTRLHVTLDRRSNTSVEQGGLREEEESHLADTAGILTLYARVEPEWKDRFARLWASMAASGFGKKKSTGKGAFHYEGMTPSSDLAEQPGANGFVSLSHFTPASGDPTDGDYAFRVKYGKLGEEFAAADNPFKRPLTLLKPGSCFRASSPIRPWYGRAVPGLAPARPEALQMAFALALPICFPDDGPAASGAPNVPGGR